jgi:hypothetical protein
VIERKKTLNVFKDARDAWGSFDDFPVGQPGTDPMPHLSRNRCAQPFWLVAEADHVLIQMAGTGRIELVGHPTLQLQPGDTVYIPGCVPSRIVPDGENIQIRLKPEPNHREAVAWFCDCGELVRSIDIVGIPQAAYLEAVNAFNTGSRTCASCGREHPRAELGDIAWDQTAAALQP